MNGAPRIDGDVAAARSGAGVGWAFWILPAAAVINRGWPRLAIVCYAVAAAIPLALLGWLLRAPGRLRRRFATVATAAILVGVTAGIAIAYPRLGTHAPGHGSDRDDALDLAVKAILDGRYPYAERTYLGNPITPLPGAIVLSLPSALLGGSAYLSPLWLALYAVLVARRGGAPAALAALAIVVSCPGALRELLTGGDLIGNGCYVAAFLLAVAGHPRLGAPRGKDRTIAFVAAVALGLSVASRPGFLFVLPLLLARLLRETDRRRAVALAAAAAAATAAVVLPFVVARPDAFSPLQLAHKYDAVLPRSGAIAVAAAVVATLVLLPVASRSLAGLLTASAVASAVPILLLTAASAVPRHWPLLPGLLLRLTPSLPLAAAALALRRHEGDAKTALPTAG